MTVSFGKTTDLEALEAIFDFDCLPRLLPSIRELAAIANLRGCATFTYYVHRGIHVIGIAVLVLERRSVSGFRLNTFSLLGHDFFDCNCFFCEDNYSEAFVEYIRNDLGRYNADALILENIQSSEIRGIGGWISQSISVFDASRVASGEGFDAILKKQRLKKQYNKGTRKSKYSCEHVVSAFSRGDIETLGSLHRERWNLDGVKSGFMDRERVDLYCAHRTNKVLTILRDGSEIIATHYGMILGQTFLFHTPAINIKYLDISPLQILLYEIAAFCKHSHLSVLDFGLGDEEYKKRFSNSSREVGYAIIPLSLRGRICKYVSSSVDTGTLKARTVNSLRKFKATARRIIDWRREIIYYAMDQYSKQNQNIADGIPMDAFSLTVITDCFSLVSLFRNNDIEISRHHCNRIKAGSVLFCLIGNGRIHAFGWGTKESVFYVSEIDRNIANVGKMLLFDFVTLPALRRRGYYTLLLRKISTALAGESLAIFADKGNIAANRAILKAGFSVASYDVI